MIWLDLSHAIFDPWKPKLSWRLGLVLTTGLDQKICFCVFSCYISAWWTDTCTTTWWWRRNATSTRTSGSWGTPRLTWSWPSSPKFPQKTSRSTTTPELRFPLTLVQHVWCKLWPLSASWFSSWPLTLARTKLQRVTRPCYLPGYRA